MGSAPCRPSCRALDGVPGDRRAFGPCPRRGRARAGAKGAFARRWHPHQSPLAATGRWSIAAAFYPDNTCGCGGIGRRAALRSLWGNTREGSSPFIRTRNSPVGHARIKARAIPGPAAAPATRRCRPRTRECGNDPPVGSPGGRPVGPAMTCDGRQRHRQAAWPAPAERWAPGRPPGPPRGRRGASPRGAPRPMAGPACRARRFRLARQPRSDDRELAV